MQDSLGGGYERDRKENTQNFRDTIRKTIHLIVWTKGTYMQEDKFLLPREEDKFRKMLVQHGKAFVFSPKEIGCVDPRINGADGNLHDQTHDVETEANSYVEGTYSEDH